MGDAVNNTLDPSHPYVTNATSTIDAITNAITSLMNNLPFKKETEETTDYIQGALEELKEDPEV